MISLNGIYTTNKLELNSNAFVVTDKSLALEILMSDSFNVVDLKGYLNKLGSISGKSFTRLESFVSMSPFFNEGQLHQTLKKAMSLAFTRENLNYWKPFFESKIDELHNQLVTNLTSLTIVLNWQRAY